MSKDLSTPFISKKTVSPWYYNKFFKYTIGLLLVLSIIYLGSQVLGLLSPIFTFASTLFAPILIGFVFYYLLRPIVHRLERWRIPRVISIILLYILIAFLLVIFFTYLFPVLAEQITAIADMSVNALEKVKGTSQVFSIGPFTLNLREEIEQRLLALLQQVTVTVSHIFVDLVGLITRIATILAVIPFIVFYLLKEDEGFSSKFLTSFPEDFVKEVRKVLKEIDETLSSYVIGLALVSLSVGGMLFFGYLIIGLDYALILSMLALILTSVPFVGPFLAITPALLVGLSSGLFATIKVAIVFLIVQQIESNFISPQIIGHRLNVHPLTIILLLLAAGSLYGLIGLILATPAYAVLKVLFQSLYKIYRLRYSNFKKQLNEP